MSLGRACSEKSEDREWSHNKDRIRLLTIEGSACWNGREGYTHNQKLVLAAKKMQTKINGLRINSISPKLSMIRHNLFHVSVPSLLHSTICEVYIFCFFAKVYVANARLGHLDTSICNMCSNQTRLSSFQCDLESLLLVTFFYGSLHYESLDSRTSWQLLNYNCVDSSLVLVLHSSKLTPKK